MNTDWILVPYDLSNINHILYQQMILSEFARRCEEVEEIVLDVSDPDLLGFVPCDWI